MSVWENKTKEIWFADLPCCMPGNQYESGQIFTFKQVLFVKVLIPNWNKHHQQLKKKKKSNKENQLFTLCSRKESLSIPAGQRTGLS